jgi:hypothetical protein
MGQRIVYNQKVRFKKKRPRYKVVGISFLFSEWNATEYFPVITKRLPDSTLIPVQHCSPSPDEPAGFASDLNQHVVTPSVTKRRRLNRCHKWTAHFIRNAKLYSRFPMGFRKSRI